MKLRIEVLYDPERFRLGSQKNAPSSTKGVADEIANTGSQEFFGWTVQNRTVAAIRDDMRQIAAIYCVTAFCDQLRRSATNPAARTHTRKATKTGSGT